MSSSNNNTNENNNIATETQNQIQKPASSSIKDIKLDNKTVDVLNKLNQSGTAAQIDISALNPETLENLTRIVDAAEKLMTPQEKERRKKEDADRFEREQRRKDEIDKWCQFEVFTIPRKGIKNLPSKQYEFIGYDTDQYIEINNLANTADDIAIKNNGKPTDDWAKAIVSYWKKMVKYSLEDISDEVINRLSRKELEWLAEVMKEKNQNPLPFGANESKNGSSSMI